MKKILRRITVLALVATLFVMPASTALAARPTPELVLYAPGTKYFRFKPTPYFLEGNGHSLILEDTTTNNGWWEVPAGKPFRCQVTLAHSTPGTFQVLIASPSGIEYKQLITSFYALCDIPAKSTDTRYQVWVTSYSQIEIDSYGGYLD